MGRQLERAGNAWRVVPTARRHLNKSESATRSNLFVWAASLLPALCRCICHKIARIRRVARNGTGWLAAIDHEAEGELCNGRPTPLRSVKGLLQPAGRVPTYGTSELPVTPRSSAS